MESLKDLKTLSTSEREDFREPSARVFNGRLWAYGLAAGFLAGLAAGLAGEGVLGWFDPNIRPASFHAPAAEQRDRAARIHRAEIAQTALLMGLLGGLEGLSLGLAGGLARRSTRWAAGAAAAGVILGTGAAVVSSCCVMPYYITNRNFVGGSFRASLLIHGALGMPAGAMGGLALGIGLGGWNRTARALAGGLAGAALGTLLNDVVSAALFPLSRTDQPVSDTWDSRVTARLMVGILSAALAVAFASSKTSGKGGDPLSS